MKTIERSALILFSTLMLVISVLLCLTIFGWVDTNFIGDVISVSIANPVISNILLVLSIICILLAIRCKCSCTRC